MPYLTVWYLMRAGAFMCIHISASLSLMITGRLAAVVRAICSLVVLLTFGILWLHITPIGLFADKVCVGTTVSNWHGRQT